MPADVTFRPAEPADQLVITELQYAALFTPPGTRALPRTVVDHPDVARSHADFGTRDGDVGVVAERRGQGVGERLIRRLLTVTPRCSLSVDERNPAHRLYQRVGFREVRRDGSSIVMLHDRGATP